MLTHFKIPTHLIRMRALTLCLKPTVRNHCASIDDVTCKDCLRIHKEARKYANHPLHGYLYPTEASFRLSCTEQVAEYCQEQRYLPREVMRVFYLDAHNQVLEEEILNTGTATSCHLDTKALLGTALELQAKGIILVHNHPSGNCTPSPDDYRITQMIRKMGEVLDIELLEHLVVSRTDWRRIESR